MASGVRTVRLSLAAVVLRSTAVLVGGYAEAERTSDRVVGDPSVEQAFLSGDRSPVGFTHEAERLGTGSKSSGGESAARLGLPDRIPDPAAASVSSRIVAIIPPAVVNAVAYLFPRWIGVSEGAASLALVASVLRWPTLAYRLWDHRVDLRSLIRDRRR